MDVCKSTHLIDTMLKNNMRVIPPVQLWVGPEDLLVSSAQKWFATLYCDDGGCFDCVTCNQIASKQHHAIQWIFPEKHYTVDQIDEIVRAVTLKLEDNHKSFFVIQQADALQTMSANRLLKTLEEPSAGYHFLLFTMNRNLLLPTIVSRSVVYTFEQESSDQTQGLVAFFTTKLHALSPIDFLQRIDQAVVHERENQRVVSDILRYWSMRYHDLMRQDDKKNLPNIEAMLDIIMHASERLPMPGGSKIFWKNLYLSLTEVLVG